MTNGSGVSRGDRNRNGRLSRLRGLVPLTNAIVAVDLVGISTGKAAAWAKLAVRDWSDYDANRADRR